MRKQNTKGFTVIELMVILVIMGIIGGISIPAWRNHIVRTRLSCAERQVLSTLRLAHTKAITEHITYCVLFDKTNTGYKTGPDSTNTGNFPTYGSLTPLPDGIVIANSFDITYVFFPDHRSDMRPCDVTIEDAVTHKSKIFYANPATAHVKVQ